MPRLALIVLVAALVASCAQGARLRPEKVESPTEIKGQYTVILYGVRHQEDLDGIAILDLEGDDYEFVPRTPDFNYKVIKGIDGQAALSRAGALLGVYRPIRRFVYRRLEAPGGLTIGYEMRPLYFIHSNDEGTIYTASYRLGEGGKVRVRFNGRSVTNMRLIVIGN